MKTKKRGLINVIVIMMLLVLSLGLVCCTDNQETPPPPDYGEAGTYYFETETDEFTLSLSSGAYSLTIYGELESGAYEFDGTNMKLYKSETDYYSATVSDSVITLTHGSGTYRFLKKVAYTVTYEVDGGSAIEAAKVINGKTVNKPADPVKGGCTFVGWYADAAFTTPFAFDSTIITADTTIYAQYVANSVNETEYVVTLMVDGEELQKAKTVQGVAVGLPTPEKEGATFAGWYVSDYQNAEKLTYKYDGEVLTEDTALFAVWESESLAVTVKGNTASWTALAAGTEYTVALTDAEGNDLVTPYKTTALTYDFDFAAMDAGDYIVKVTAGSKTGSAYVLNKALDRVSGFTVVEPAMLVFDGVKNAQKYVISVVCGNSEHNHTNYDNGISTSFNFVNCDMKKGGIEFVVTAMANGYATSVSDKFVYNRELGAVANLSYDANTGSVSWTKVNGALGYVVEVTAGEKTVSYNVYETAISLKEYSGSVEVKVTAVAKGYNSAEATALTFVNEKLAAPVVALDYNTVVWNVVEGATSYNVMVGDQVFTATTNKLAIPEEYLVKGQTYAISVQAVADTDAKSSVYSDVLTVKYGEMTDVTYSNGALKWSPVGGAYKYAVRVNNGKEIVLNSDVTSTEVTFTKEGANTVTLYAYDFNYRALDIRTVTVNAHAVVFDVRGGNEVETLYKAAGDKIELPVPEKEGYTLAGWYNAPGGAGSNGAKYESGIYSETGSMMLFADWQPNAYTITLKVVNTIYNAETGEFTFETVTVGTETVYYKQDYTLPVVQSSDKSKTFGGWFEDDNANSMQFADPYGVGVSKWNLTQDHTLYAGWIDILAYELIDGVDGKYYQVVGGDGVKYVTEITVPEVYVDPETKIAAPVTAIATGAFADCNELQVLNIPDCIESIYLGFGSNLATGSALYHCYALREINVYCPDEENHASHETFYHSEDGMLIRHASPTTETLDRGVELVYVPYNRSGTLVVPDGVEHITTRSLYGLRFTKAVIPASVKYIGDYVFYSGSYRSIEFLPAAEGVEEVKLEIGENAFNACTSLSEVKLPARLGIVDFHETQMFNYNPALSHIEITGEYTADGNNYMSSIDGVVCNYDGSELLFYPRYRAGNYKIPAEVQIIGEYAFYGCYEIEQVVIGSNVLIIEESAFGNCNKLRVVEFEDGKGSLEINDWAFQKCSKLVKADLPSQLTFLGAHVFAECVALTEIVINSAPDAQFSAQAFADSNSKGYVRVVTLGKDVPAFEVNSVFAGCQLYELDTVGNDNYTADDKGVLYTAEKDKILYYPHGTAGEYTMPETVKEISEGVFEGRANLTKITIGKNVTRIGARAFSGCVGLSEIVFEEGRSEDLVIEANAFEGCIGLRNIVLPEMTKSVGDNAFVNCTNLETVHIPASLTAIGSSAANALKIFDGCTSLSAITVADGNASYATSNGLFYGKENGVPTTLFFVPKGYTGEVVIPSTVANIGANLFKEHPGVTKVSFENNTAPETLVLGATVFQDAKALVEVRLPSGLKVIPAKTFMGSSVQKIYIPNTVTTINTQAFADCEDLTTIEFEPGNDAVALTFTAATSATTSAFSGTKKLATIELPDRTAAITNYMFAGSNVTSVKFPANATSIGNYAFANCTGLTELVLPDKIQTLGTYTFVGCVNLKKLVLPAGLKALPNYMCGKVEKSTSFLKSSPGYEPCSSLESITIPATVTSMGTYVFRGCSSLKEVIFEDGINLPSIGNYAFTDCGFTSFEMPDSVTTIGTNAFGGCTALKSIKLSKNLTTIGNCAFGFQQASSGMLSSTIGHEACTSLESITIPASVKAINQYAFRDCTALKSIVFEEGSVIESFGNYAFQGSGLTSFNLPETASSKKATTFGTSIFMNCTSLKEVYLPKTVTALNAAFVGCSLNTLVMANDGDDDVSNDPYFVDSENGVVYNGDKNTIQLYYGSAAEFVVPEGVHTIADNAFAGNTSITKITLPKSLQKIGAYAFSSCTALKTVDIPGDGALTTIGNCAFNKSGITSIVVPGTVTSMGNYVFEQCTSLNSAVVNTSVMGSYMFTKCSALTSVTLADVVTFKGYTFAECTSLTRFEFPKTVLGFGTQEFAGSGLTSIHIPAGLPIQNAAGDTSPSGNMFYDCVNLKTVTMDDSYTFIPYKMFADCSSLESFTIPKSVTYIGTNAFINCTSLKTLVVPKEVTSLQIGMGAFSRCGIEELDLSHVTNLTFVWNSSFGYYDGYQFGYNANLKTVKLPDTLVEIPRYMFRECSALESVEAKGAEIIGEYVFYLCNALTNVVISANATEIGNYAFGGTTSLKSFDVPNTVTTLAQAAFQSSGIETINLGTSLTTIGKNAFQKSQLKSIVIPASVTSIDATAFADCANLERIEVAMGNTAYYAGDYGELYNSLDQLVVFPAMCSADNGYFEMRPGTTLVAASVFANAKNLYIVKLADTVSTIPASTFSGSSIRRIEIPSTVTSIDSNAFTNCLNLTEVIIPDTVVTIGSGAFSGCTALEKITLPKNLATISTSTFKGCTALKTITLPENLTLIEASAFENSGLTEIEFPAKLKQIKAKAFANTKLVHVVIPATLTKLGTEETAQSGSSGGIGGIIISPVIPGIGGTTSSNSANSEIFAGCTELKTVVFEGVPEFIDKGMFKGCTALESVTFAEGWDTITKEMFSGCTSLNLELPATVETIGEDAFAGWTADQTITISITAEEAVALYGEGWNGEAKVVEK